MRRVGRQVLVPQVDLGIDDFHGFLSNRRAGGAERNPPF
jgi:hypothetical protein